MPLTEIDTIRIRQFIQNLEAGLLDGLSVFVTYHDSDLGSTPSNPTGDGTTGGWHTDSTADVNWMSTKRAHHITEGTWGNPMAIRGLTGETGAGGDSAVVYYIKPTDGTAIKNGTGTLTIEAHKIIGSVDAILSAGTIKLYDPSNNEITVANGYAAGSDGYTGVFDASDISLSKVITMKDGTGGSPLDTITLVDILDGVDAVVYYIKPTDGTAIHNGTGTLTLEAHKITAGSDVLLSTGTIKLYDPSNNEITVANGYAAGSDGYTGVFDAGDINLSKVITMKDGTGGTVLDTVTVIDILDGTDAIIGSVESDNGLVWVQAPGPGAWTPAGTTTTLTVRYYQSGAQINTRTVVVTRSEATLTAPTPDTVDGITYTRIGNGTSALTILFEHVASDIQVGETVYAVEGSNDAIVGYVESDIGLVWLQAPGPGAWTPAGTECTLTVRYYQSGAQINTRTVVITRSDATLTAPEPDTVDGITYSRIGSGTSAITIMFEHVAGEIVVSETVYAVAGPTSSGGGLSDDVPILRDITFIGSVVSEKVGWTAGYLDYGGDTYEIVAKAVDDGSTNAYIYWDADDTNTTFKTTDSLATAIGAGNWVVCKNEAGVARPAAVYRLLLGGLIQANTITASTVIIANTVTDTLLSPGVSDDIAQGIADAATAQAAAVAAQADADTGIADAATAQAELDDIAADSKVTPVEKLEAKQRWDAIVVEGTATTGTIPVQATAFGVADTDFDTAYAALNTYLNTTISVFANMATTTDMVRTAWDTAWKNYYDERTKLLNAIATAAKDLADAAQADADTAIANAATAQGTADDAQTDATTALNALAAKAGTFYQDTVPTALAAGDIWFDTNDGNKMYRATAAGDNEVKAGEWETVDLTIIDGGNITAGTILAGSIGVASLAAISAALGTITSGSITLSLGGDNRLKIDSTGIQTSNDAGSSWEDFLVVADGKVLLSFDGYTDDSIIQGAAIPMVAGWEEHKAEEAVEWSYTADWTDHGLSDATELESSLMALTFSYANTSRTGGDCLVRPAIWRIESDESLTLVWSGAQKSVTVAPTWWWTDEEKIAWKGISTRDTQRHFKSGYQIQRVTTSGVLTIDYDTQITTLGYDPCRKKGVVS